MSEPRNPAAAAFGPTRRQMISAGAAAIGSLSIGTAAWGKMPAAAEPPSTGADKLRTSLHQEIVLTASPHRL
ncbi:MAG: hypothetical protein WAN97_04325 [Candidatus Acidiferrales bacterium]